MPRWTRQSSRRSKSRRSLPRSQKQWRSLSRLGRYRPRAPLPICRERSSPTAAPTSSENSELCSGTSRSLLGVKKLQIGRSSCTRIQILEKILLLKEEAEFACRSWVEGVCRGKTRTGLRKRQYEATLGALHLSLSCHRLQRDTSQKTNTPRAEEGRRHTLFAALLCALHLGFQLLERGSRGKGIEILGQADHCEQDAAGQRKKKKAYGLVTMRRLSAFSACTRTLLFLSST